MASKEDVASLFYVRDNHFTARGHRAAAACMVNELDKIVK